MKITSLFKNKKIWSTAIAVVLLFACLIPVQNASAATVVGVDGRTLPAVRAGDSSDWIEIARYGGYCLIIRQTPITSKLTYFHNQHVNLADNKYVFSVLRKSINSWYNDTLPQNARLRNFAVGNDIDPVKMWNTGTVGVFNGPKSTPNGVISPKGDEIAFALSFAEAAQFCGTQYVTTTASVIACPTLAINNFNKLLPKANNGSTDPNPAYWLRSDGIGSSTISAGCVAYSGGSPYDSAKGRVYQHTVIGTYGHYRPAMWVGEGIFGETVTYEPNGGIGTRNVVPVAQNSYYTIVSQGYLPPDNTYQFDSWNTMPNGSGVRYDNGQTIYITTSITLYAQWKKVPVPPLTVTYYPNGGIGAVTTDINPPNTNYTIRGAIFQPPSVLYTFNNWNTRADGLGTSYTAGQIIYLTASLTLYAQWKPVVGSLAVTYYPNGGIGAVTTDNPPANANYTIRGAIFQPPSSLYTFDNWNTRADGLGTTYTAGQVIYLTASLTLYAQWKPVVGSPMFYVIYDPNGGVGTTNVIPVPANTYYMIQSQGYWHTNSNLVFDGWNTMPNGTGTNYNNGNTVYMNNNLILFAKWRTGI